MKKPEWAVALGLMFDRAYWTKANTVEFFAFLVKAAIIIPGLLFGIELWWLYIAALATSVSLVWSSTVKTIPTLIWFNIVWSFLATIKLAMHFVS
jgi:hypothetical protein